MRVLSDSWQVPEADSANVMICLTRCAWVREAGWRDGRVTWTLWEDCPRGDEWARHHHLKTQIARVVSLHSVEGWQ